MVALDRVEQLTEFERKEMLRYLLHHMPMETRLMMKDKYPVHYRKLTEQES